MIIVTAIAALLALGWFLCCLVAGMRTKPYSAEWRWWEVHTNIATLLLVVAVLLVGIAFDIEMAQ